MNDQTPRGLELRQESKSLGLRVYRGSKASLQAAGIATGRGFPGDPGRTRRSSSFIDRLGRRVSLTLVSDGTYDAAVCDAKMADVAKSEAAALSAPQSIASFRSERCEMVMRLLAHTAAMIFEDDGGPIQFVRGGAPEEELLIACADLATLVEKLPARDISERRTQVDFILRARAAREDTAFNAMLAGIVR